MNNCLVINTNQLVLTGCIKAKTNNQGKYKLRIVKDSNVFTYDIFPEKYQIYPLQCGKGKYIIGLYKNIINTKYSLQQKIQIDINQSNYYLYPNIYVNYNNLKDIFIQAKKLTKQNKNFTIKNIKKYISKNYKYNHIKSSQLKLKKNILPNIQECFNTKTGICQDLAALTVALFRINNIPSKFIIGYIENKYHAWTEYYDEQKQKWILFDPTQAIFNAKVNIQNYVIERWY